MPNEQEYAAAVQMHMDSAAQSLGYDNIYTAVSYAEEAEVPQYLADGRLFRRWRSKVWAKVFALQAAEATGTVEELIAALPPLHDSDAPPGEPSPEPD